MSRKLVPHSISNRLDDTKVEKCGPKLIILVNSFYAYRKRRRTSSNPSGKAPSSSKKFSQEECTTYVMRPITDSSRTHGTRPDSGDSTPSAELSVCLLTPPPCQCQNRRISSRGSRSVRLRLIVTGSKGQNVYPGSGPLDGGNTLLPVGLISMI